MGVHGQKGKRDKDIVKFAKWRDEERKKEREKGGRKGQKEKGENQGREAKVQKGGDIDNYLDINYLKIFSYKKRLV